jgi:hypothetical protein
LITPAGTPTSCRERRQRPRRQRRQLRRLGHHRAPGGQRRRQLARQHRGREVPRRHQRAHADRHALDDDLLIGAGRRDGLAVDPRRLAGEPREEARRVAHLADRLGGGLAALGGDQRAQPRLVGAHPPRQLGQELAARGRRDRPPRRPRGLGRRDRRVDGRVVAFVDPVEHRVGRRIADREPRGRHRSGPSAAASACVSSRLSSIEQ